MNMTDTQELRDHFAATALNGLLSTGEDYVDIRRAEGGWEWFAVAAYAMADAMLAEREQSKC